MKALGKPPNVIAGLSLTTSCTSSIFSLCKKSSDKFLDLLKLKKKIYQILRTQLLTEHGKCYLLSVYVNIT